MFPKNCRVDPGSVETNVGIDIVLCFCAGGIEKEGGGKERGGRDWRAAKEGESPSKKKQQRKRK